MLNKILFTEIFPIVPSHVWRPGTAIKTSVDLLHPDAQTQRQVRLIKAFIFWAIIPGFEKYFLLSWLWYRQLRVWFVCQRPTISVFSFWISFRLLFSSSALNKKTPLSLFSPAHSGFASSYLPPVTAVPRLLKSLLPGGKGDGGDQTSAHQQVSFLHRVHRPGFRFSSGSLRQSSLNLKITSISQKMDLFPLFPWQQN